MAHLRRNSRRNPVASEDAPTQLAPEPAKSLTNGELVEKDKDIVMQDSMPREGTGKDAPPLENEVEAEMDPETLKAEEAQWDSFREEFHEVIEQLPLYLHRQFTLMRELDEQTHQHSTDLMSDIHRYIDLRSKLAGVSLKATPELSTSGEPVASGSAQPPNDVIEPQPANQVTHPDSSEGPPPQSAAPVNPSDVRPPPVSEQQQGQVLPPDGDAFDEVPVPWNATRTLLPQIGWLTDEILRTSEEKINLAQTIYDMIHRHIRQLDHSIKEQETAISIGSHKGTHPSLLEDLLAPRWHRQAQSTLPADDINDEDASEPTLNNAPKTPMKKGRGRPPLTSASQAMPNGARTGLKFKLKRPPLGNGQSSQGDGGGEELYCVCKRPSSGTMVMCDNEECQNGSWFHLDCLGMKETPPDDATWYCPQCEPTFTARPKPTKRRRR
ncbi:hypothetical protein PENSPDRAFT_648379 [Peniophora sp. CONT]|nr:hypothetical protein PENSPDRAFT_648379 [Peniophora sp. CONT]